MADDFTWMLGMHRIASQFGDGLKPELIELLTAQHHRADSVRTLPVRQKSSGPARQTASDSDLTAANIVRFPSQTGGLASAEQDEDIKSDKNTQPFNI